MAQDRPRTDQSKPWLWPFGSRDPTWKPSVLKLDYTELKFQGSHLFRVPVGSDGRWSRQTPNGVGIWCGVYRVDTSWYNPDRKPTLRYNYISHQNFYVKSYLLWYQSGKLSSNCKEYCQQNCQQSQRSTWILPSQLLLISNTISVLKLHTYSLAFRAKDIAMETIYSTHKDAYNALPQYCCKLEAVDPNTKAVVEHTAENRFYRMLFAMEHLQLGLQLVVLFSASTVLDLKQNTKEFSLLLRASMPTGPISSRIRCCQCRKQ